MSRAGRGTTEKEKEMPPQKIYIQDIEGDEPTWCEDQIHEDDIPYVLDMSESYVYDYSEEDMLALEQRLYDLEYGYIAE